MKRSNRWALAYGNYIPTQIDRITRGECLRRIRANAPGFIGADKLSINDLQDVERYINRCEVLRQAYTLGVTK